MNYLAFKKEHAGLIFPINDIKTQLNILIDEYPDWENMFFYEDELSDAQEWSGSDKVEYYSDKALKKLNEINNRYCGHSFKILLGEYTRQGYTHVNLTLSNGFVCTIFIRDFFTLDSNCFPDFYVKTKMDLQNNRVEFSHLQSLDKDETAHNMNILKYEQRYLSFNEVNSCFDKRYQGNNYISRDKCLYIMMKSGLFEKNELNLRKFSCSRYKSSVINTFDDLAKIDIAYKIPDRIDKRHIYNFEDNAYNKVKDLTININQICDIVPYTFDSAITDEDWINSIYLLLLEGFDIYKK